MQVTSIQNLPNLSFIKQKRIINGLKMFNIFGMIPCQVDLLTKKRLKCNQLKVLILLNILFLILIHFSAFWWFRHLTLTASANLILVITETFLIWIVFLGHFIIIIEAIYYHKTFIKLLKNLLYLVELCGNNLITIKLTVFLKIRILIVINVFCHIGYAISTYFNTTYLYYWMHCFWPSLACCLKHILSIYLIDLIKYHLLVILRNVQEPRHSANRSFIDLKRLKQIYGYCWDASQLFNQAYGFSSLVLIGHLFTVSLTNLYWVFLHLLFSELHLITPSDYIYFCIILMNYMVLVYLFSQSCDECFKICLKIVGNLHKITDHDNNKHLQGIIKSFTMQINQTPIKFDANGFFTINKEIVGSLIMAILTYLIILIQIN